MDKEPRVIAMYLPQFHSIPENSVWWGEGYTEWKAVQSAQKLYANHNQPRVPLNKYYYNLLDKNVMEWQSVLMNTYGIDGLCFYHYWFKDGRRILEKPAENLLRWRDINMPFCFSWANESWIRTWSNLEEGNIWSSRFEHEGKNKKENEGILIEQKYGDKADWKVHFEYLLPFFEDRRYIRIDDKPLFIIYKPTKIPSLIRMLKYWRQLAKEYGLNGIYIIGTNAVQNMELDAIMYQEPQYTIQSSLEQIMMAETNKGVKLLLDGQKIWSDILTREYDTSMDIFLGGFTGYDDTPRRGKDGTVIGNLNPTTFYENMKKLFAKSIQMKCQCIFINAWNEWGEGMYLEPDEIHRYQYLEALKNAKSDYKSQIIGVKCDREKIYKNRQKDEKIKRLAATVEKYRGYWSLLDRWLFKMEKGGGIERFFVQKGYYDIAIYGLGMLGKHLVNELSGTSVNVKYGIDRNNEKFFSFPIYKSDEKLPNVNVIVVTIMYEFDCIYENLFRKVECPVISIEEVIEDWI